jgi:pimeloyl-ACP methyl ester carboxylesterase
MTPTTAAAPMPASLQWSDCGDGLECATLTVPLDYGDPQTATIDLAVAREPSTSDEPVGSLIVNPGGPGGSGIEFLRDGGVDDLRGSFDLVSWDPRGVGDSRPLDCASDASFYELDPQPDDATEKAALEQSARALADTCAAADPTLLPTLTTTNAARDLEQLRRALGDEPLNYFGFSYGTHIGLDYAALFPDHIRAMALDGVVDPSESLTQFLTGQAQAVEQALGDELDLYRRLTARLETNPIHLADGREVGPGILGVAAIESTYEPGGAQRLRRALQDGLDGDGTRLRRLADDYIGEASFASYLGVLCADGPHPGAGDQWWQFIDQITREAPDFGAGIGNELLPCAYWPVDPVTSPGPTQWPVTLPPILLVASTGDAATPIDDAQRVHAELANSVLVVRQGDGHTSYQVGDCVTDAVRTYLVNGRPPVGDASCPS